jgi:hypothetical protein
MKIGHVAPVDGDFAAVDVEKASKYVEPRGLAAARGPEENDELGVGDVEIEVLDDGLIAVSLHHIAELHGRHVAYPLIAPAVMP